MIRNAINEYFDYLDRNSKDDIHFQIYYKGLKIFETNKLIEFIEHTELLTFDKIEVIPF